MEPDHPVLGSLVWLLAGLSSSLAVVQRLPFYARYFFTGGLNALMIKQLVSPRVSDLREERKPKQKMPFFMCPLGKAKLSVLPWSLVSQSIHPQCNREGPTQCVSWLELEIAGPSWRIMTTEGYHMHAFLLKARSKTDSAREDYTCTFFVCSTYLSCEGFSMSIYGYVKPTSLLACSLYKEE